MFHGFWSIWNKRDDNERKIVATPLSVCAAGLLSGKMIICLQGKVVMWYPYAIDKKRLKCLHFATFPAPDIWIILHNRHKEAAFYEGIKANKGRKGTRDL